VDLFSSFVKESPRNAVITGSTGIINVPRFSAAEQFTVTRPGSAPETIECEAAGFDHEIREVHRCLRAGLIESPSMPHKETLDIIRTADSLRALWGMKYPRE